MTHLGERITPLVDGQLAGFAMLSAYSHSGAPADHDMAEFFIVRKPF